MGEYKKLREKYIKIVKKPILRIFVETVCAHRPMAINLGTPNERHILCTSPSRSLLSIFFFHNRRIHPQKSGAWQKRRSLISRKKTESRLSKTKIPPIRRLQAVCNRITKRV